MENKSQSADHPLSPTPSQRPLLLPPRGIDPVCLLQLEGIGGSLTCGTSWATAPSVAPSRAVFRAFPVALSLLRTDDSRSQRPKGKRQTDAPLFSKQETDERATGSGTG